MTSLAMSRRRMGRSLRDRPGCGSVAVARTVRLGGYRRGAILQVTGLAGLALGFLVGIRVAPLVAGLVGSDPAKAGVELGTVLIFGVVGDAVGSILGTKLRRRAIGERFKKADALGGAALSVSALVLAIWFLGSTSPRVRSPRSPVHCSAPPSFERSMRRSRPLPPSRRSAPSSM